VAAWNLHGLACLRRALCTFEVLWHVICARVYRPGASQRVALSALVLTPSSAAPAPASPHGLLGYEPQRSGVLGDEQPAHFIIEEIPRIPSRSNRSPEPRSLAKRIACYHPRSPCAFSPLSAFVGHPSRSACARTLSDRATAFGHSSKSFRGLRSRALVAADSFAPFAASAGSLFVALRPAYSASGTIGHCRPLRSRHVAPQFGNASAPLPNQPQFGNVSTAARRRQAAASVSVGACGSMDSAWTGAPAARIVYFRSPVARDLCPSI
jgi:hypothetical protein